MGNKKTTRKRSDKDKYLEKRGNTIRFVMRTGEERMQRNLETLDYAEARRKRDYFLATGRWDSAEELLKEARSFRMPDGLLNRQKVREREGEYRAEGELKKATLFRAMAEGAVPLDTAVSRWHATKGKSFKERTKSDHRTAVARLGKWLNEERKGTHFGNPPLFTRGAFIQVVTPEIAAEYGEHLEASGINGRTGNKHLNSLRSLWRFVRVMPNPWTGVSMAEHNSETVLERPFEDDEVQRLLTGDGDETMLTVIRMALLTGARLEEIFKLRVQDVRDGVAWFLNSKRRGPITRRPVPLHKDIRKAVEKLCKDRGSDEFVIKDGDATGWDGARSMAFSKRFATYRRRCRVDEKVEGQRRSKVNFHSCRRWLAHQFEKALVPEVLAGRILGHKFESMTYGVYSQGGNIEEMRKALLKIRLPIDHRT